MMMALIMLTTGTAVTADSGFDPFETISNILASPWLNFLWRVTIVFVFMLWFSAIIWTYRDAKYRGAIGVAWAAAVLFFNFIGLIIYLILRPPEFTNDAKERELEIELKEYQMKKQAPRCPACLRFVDEDFQICPYCYKKLKNTCLNCNRLLSVKWTVCPYCRTNQRQA